VRIEVDADAGPFQARGNLLDMRRFAGAVIALDHDAAVERKARDDRQRGVRIEHVGRIKIGHPLIRLGKGGNFHVDIDAERLADVDLNIGR